jgi:hypothetical protein
VKQCLGGDGTDTTAAVLQWLAANQTLWIRTLYLIGEPEDPQSIWLTDHESPLVWSLWGTFQSAVVKRGGVPCKIGLDVQQLSITWTPKAAALAAQFPPTISNSAPRKLAQIGYYDNWRVRAWKVFMPTPGDANTFGACPLFGGRISDIEPNSNEIVFTVNSFLDAVNQYAPLNVVEATNTAAAYMGATPPKGFVHVPQFVVEDGSSTNVVVGFQTSPVEGSILDDNVARGGWLVFNTTAPDPTANPPFPGSTLGGVWSEIQQNTAVNTGGTGGGGGRYNQFILSVPLPWPPTPGLDSFYVSGKSPVDQSDGDFFGFPYVPTPQSAV